MGRLCPYITLDATKNYNNVGRPSWVTSNVLARQDKVVVDMSN